MGRRYQRNDDSLFGGLFEIVTQCWRLAGEMAPLGAVGVGLLMLLIGCGIIPEILATGISKPGSIEYSATSMLLGVLATVFKWAFSIGAMGCFLVAARTLLREGERDAKTILAATVIGLCIFGVLGYWSHDSAPSGAAKTQQNYSSPSANEVTTRPANATSAAIRVSPGIPALTVPNTTKLPGMPAPPVVFDTYTLLILESSHLNPRGMKLVREQRCVPYVDLFSAAMRTGGLDTTSIKMSQQRVQAALDEGYRAGCYVQKTQEEMLSSGLREYWISNKASISAAPECAVYVQWADFYVFAKKPEADRRYDLANLFLKASNNGCL